MDSPPVILLAFANDRAGTFLRNIAEEQRNLKRALKPLVEKKLIWVEELPNVTSEDIIGAFRTYKDRVKVFHYAGHAHDLDLLLNGSENPFNIQSFAEYLALQQGLELVFMNGCATSAQQKPLEAAGIPHLILTDTYINDKGAQQLATAFYQNLASSRDVVRSFSEATSSAKAIMGQDWRGFVREDQIEKAFSEFPWRMFSSPPDRKPFRLQVKRPIWPRVLGGLALLAIFSIAYATKPKPRPFDLTLVVQDERGKPMNALKRGG